MVRGTFAVNVPRRKKTPHKHHKTERSIQLPVYPPNSFRKVVTTHHQQLLLSFSELLKNSPTLLFYSRLMRVRRDCHTGRNMAAVLKADEEKVSNISAKFTTFPIYFFTFEL